MGIIVMQEWLLLNLATVIFSGVAGLSVATALMVHLSSKKRINQLEQHIDTLGKEVNALSHSTLGMGRNLKTLDRELGGLEQSIQEIHKNDPAKVSYSEAARLVSMGASIEDLMSACSISRPEAELVSALTKQRQSKASDLENDLPILKSKI